MSTHSTGDTSWQFNYTTFVDHVRIWSMTEPSHCLWSQQWTSVISTLEIGWDIFWSNKSIVNTKWGLGCGLTYLYVLTTYECYWTHHHIYTTHTLMLHTHTLTLNTTASSHCLRSCHSSWQTLHTHTQKDRHTVIALFNVRRPHLPGHLHTLPSTTHPSYNHQNNTPLTTIQPPIVRHDTPSIQSHTTNTCVSPHITHLTYTPPHHTPSPDTTPRTSHHHTQHTLIVLVTAILPTQNIHHKHRTIVVFAPKVITPSIYSSTLHIHSTHYHTPLNTPPHTHSTHRHVRTETLHHKKQTPRHTPSTHAPTHYMCWCHLSWHTLHKTQGHVSVYVQNDHSLDIHTIINTHTSSTQL